MLRSPWTGFIAVFGLFSAGCSGGTSAAGGCRTHAYTYVAAPVDGYDGAGWYDGDLSGGWYDPGDDGGDYSGIGDGSSDDGSGDNSGYDDGSGDNGGSDDGSGDNGSYDDGSGDDGSGDGSGSTDDGSGDDGSGDDGSGDDGTASKHHLHLTSATLHTQTTHASCYAYTCTLECAVDSSNAREAQGFSGISQQDACLTAQHGLENWAHDSLGRDIGACKQVSSSGTPDTSAATTPGARTPATPSVTPQGFSSTPPPSDTAAASLRPPR